MPMGRHAGGVGARRPRFRSVHGFRTNGEIMRKQVVGKWPTEVTTRLNLVFVEAPVPAEGKSDVDDIFYLPYYERFQFDKSKKDRRGYFEADMMNSDVENLCAEFMDSPSSDDYDKDDNETTVMMTIF